MVVLEEEVREPRRACLRLANELNISLHTNCATEEGEKPWQQTRVHLEQPAHSRILVVGYPEYAFLSLMDGQTSFAQALAVVAQEYGPSALSEADARQLVDWAQEQQVLENNNREYREDSQKTGGVQLHPLYSKIRLGNPQPFLDSVYPWLRWAFHPLFLTACLFAIAAAGLALLGQADRFLSSLTGIVDPSNWVWMMVAWCFLKVIHEFAHAIVCRHFGGRVHEVGVVLILLAPIAYCDVNSSWSFTSRWQRMAVAAAGIGVEMLMAALCIFLWLAEPSEFTSQLLSNVIVMATVSTVLFNANPLMRFDGYYLLSDFIQIPNLYSLGKLRIQWIWSWLLWGERASKNRWQRTRHEWFVLLYGAASGLWRITVTVGLIIAGMALLGNFAYLLALMLVIPWLLRAIQSEALRKRWALLRIRPASLLRATAVLSFCSAAGLFLWYLCPVPFGNATPCIVLHQDTSQVHIRSTGFVHEVFVRDGQEVSQGQPLLQLVSPELQSQIAQARSELAAAQLEERIASEQGLPGAAQVARHQQMAAAEKLENLELQQQELLVVSPADGYVLARNLQELEGKFLRRGDLLTRIANPDRKEIYLSLATADQGRLQSQIGTSLEFKIGNRPLLEARLIRVTPNASEEIIHPALGATLGGPLAVREKPNQGKPEAQEARFELVAPRFGAFAELAPELAQQLCSGERGYASLSNSHHTLGQWLLLGGRDWLRSKLETAGW